MQTMRCLKRVFLSVVAVLVLSVAAWSQETPSTNAHQDQQGSEESTSASVRESDFKDANTTEQPTPQRPVNPEFTQIDKATPLLPFQTPLRWGPFAVGGFEYFNIHDSFKPAGGASAVRKLSLFRTSLVFDRYFGKNHMVLQYVPQLGILDGHVRGNAGSNNVLAFGSSYVFSPRMTITIKNEFRRTQSRQLFPDDVLETDRQTGGVLQTSFLENSGSYLEDGISATLIYKLSARTEFTVVPLFKYSRLVGDQIAYVTNGRLWEGFVSLTHRITPRRTVGITYTTQRFETVKPVDSKTYFNIAGFYYSEQLSRTWWIQGRLGAESVHYSDFPGANNWAMAGGATLLKDFTKATLAVAYTHGETFAANYVTNRKGDRADISLSYHLSGRLVSKNGVGYFRAIGGDPRTRGKYGVSTLEYHLPSGLALFANYMYRFQQSSTQQLLSGSRDTFVVGFRWEPRVVPLAK